MPTIKKQGYITEKEAAELLGKSQQWLQNDRHRAKKGDKLKIPFIKQDKRILYKKNDVLTFKESLDSVMAAGLTPSKLPSRQTSMEEKTYEMARQASAKVEGLEQRVRALEEKQNKGWFARLFS